jgi:hypothetical protein
MAPVEGERKPTAILAADVVGELAWIAWKNLVSPLPLLSRTADLSVPRAESNTLKSPARCQCRRPVR